MDLNLRKLFSVYVLLDPILLIPKYVGISFDANQRYRGHIRDKSDTHKARWIRKLLCEGKRPVLSIIHLDVSIEEAKKREIELISEYRKLGHPLTNITDGGEGMNGYIWTKELRQQVSEALMGHVPWNKGLTDTIQKGRIPWNKDLTDCICGNKQGCIPWNTNLPKELQPMYNKHHSEETNQQISKSKKGKSTMTKDGRRRLSEFRKSLAKPKSPPQSCWCGCLEMTKPGNRYINGHFRRKRRLK